MPRCARAVRVSNVEDIDVRYKSLTPKRRGPQRRYKGVSAITAGSH